MRFVIIASRRTGSSHLVNMLSGHGEIFCHGNIFASKIKTIPVFWPKESELTSRTLKTLRNELRELRDADADKFLEKIFSIDHGRPHIGFKIFKGQDDNILDKVIKDQSIRKIVLFRKNVLANYGSSLAAAITGTWSVKQGHEIPETPKVLFEVDSFIKFHNKYLRFYRSVIKRLNKTRHPFHLICYDELNDTSLLASLINFIGADAGAPISEDNQHKRQVKQNPSNILSRFSNVDVVEAFLRNEGLIHWANEGQTSLEFMNEKTAGSISDKSSLLDDEEND